MVKQTIIAIILLTAICSGCVQNDGAKSAFRDYCRNSPIILDEFQAYQFSEANKQVLTGLAEMKKNEPEQCLTELTILMLRRFQLDVLLHHTAWFFTEENIFVDEFYQMSGRRPFEGGKISFDAIEWVKDKAPPYITENQDIKAIIAEIREEQRHFEEQG